MSCHTELRNFIHLQADVGIDHFVGEHAATGQELAILIQVFQRLLEKSEAKRS